MEIYFGKLTNEDLEYNLQELDELFHHMGNYYWYKAVIGGDDFVFYDTCGRHFPIATEHVAQTDLVLLCARKYQEAQDAYDVKIEEAHQLIEFFNQQECQK
jgi:hypothetical protein